MSYGNLQHRLNVARSTWMYNTSLGFFFFKRWGPTRSSGLSSSYESTGMRYVKCVFELFIRVGRAITCLLKNSFLNYTHVTE